MAEDKTFTQEEVNSLIKERLDRAEKKYTGYLSPEEAEQKSKGLADQIASLTSELERSKAGAADSAKTIAELQGKINKFENDALKVRVATAAGLSAELASRLTGTTEDELKADAEKLKTAVGGQVVVPLRNPEADAEDKNADLKSMLSNLRKK